MQQFGMTRAQLDRIHKNAEETVALQFAIKEGAQTAVPESKLLGLGAMLFKGGKFLYQSARPFLELNEAANRFDNAIELPSTVEKAYKQMLWKAYNDHGNMMMKPQIHNGQVYGPGSFP